MRRAVRSGEGGGLPETILGVAYRSPGPLGEGLRPLPPAARARACPSRPGEARTHPAGAPDQAAPAGRSLTRECGRRPAHTASTRDASADARRVTPSWAGPPGSVMYVSRRISTIRAVTSARLP